jgi:hypothetical protein
MLIKCKTGGEMIEVAEGQDPHAALDATGCSHCADGHPRDVHCGQAANACAEIQDNHPGPCWDGTGERPDGCTVCRPIIFMGNTTLRVIG